MRIIGIVGFMLGAVCTAAVAQEKGGDYITGPYDVVADWPKPMCGDGWQMGSTGGVWAQTPDRIFVFQRGCLPAIEQSRSIVPDRNASRYSLAATDPARHPRWDHNLMILNGEGELIESWERHNHLFVRPHRVVMDTNDPQDHVWLIDDGAHSVYKFTNDGDLVMTLGEFRVSGDDEAHFNRPTDIAFLPNGDFFISDGYGNTRVVKFNSAGEYLLEWGEPGTGPSQFNTVHGVATDAQDRVYVADRANSRVQIFDSNGRYLEAWNDITYPYYIYVSGDQHLWVSDGWTNKILKYDLQGKLLSSWGTFGALPGAMWGPHQFSVDQDRNLYIADVHVGRLQKYTPKPASDPALIMGFRIRAD
jgi:peptidylamidoglycolate lyase